MASSSQMQLMKQFKSSQAANMKRLLSLAEDSLEMQQLLIQTAESYMAEKKKIEQGGQTLLQACRQKKQRTPTTATDEASSALPPEGVVLRRGVRVYAGWGAKLVMELLSFLEPKKRARLQGLPKDTLYQLLEYSLDLRLHGDTLDRIGVDDKRTLWLNLRATYESCGRRLQHFALDKKEIDWAECGHFSRWTQRMLPAG